MDKSNLYTPQPPWVVLCPSSAEDAQWTPAHLYGQEGVRAEIKVLRASRMRSTVSVMNEFAAALQFFDGFGANWHALKECLSYLDEWMPADAYVLVITNCQNLLVDDEPDSLKWLLLTLQEVGEFWSRPIYDKDRFDRPAIPFHTVLTCPAEGMANLQGRIDAAGVRVVATEHPIHGSS